MDLMILFVVMFSTLIFAALFHHIFQSNHIKCNQLPPGKMGFPLAGESLDLLSSLSKGQAENFVFNRISKYSSRVFKTHLLGEPVILMHGPTENKFLYTNENKLVTEWWPKHVGKLVPSTTAESFKMRELLHPVVKPDALHRYVQVMDNMIQKHLQSNWQGKNKVLAVPTVKYCTLAVACRIFLSVEDEELIEKFMAPTRAVAAGFSSFPLNLPWTKFGKAMAASRELKTLLRPIIKERKASVLLMKHSSVNIQQDFLTSSLLTTDEHGKQMSEEELVDRALEILIAGHESITGMISLLLSRLADHPDVYSRVLHEQMTMTNSKAPGQFLSMDDIHKLTYLSNVTREVMRLHPPSLFAFRQVISDFTYGGFRIPKGWKILFNMLPIHKDPQYFPHPEKFDPSRFEGDGPASYTFIPFGGGTLLCPGKNYAQLVIAVFMHNVVKMFKWDKVLPNEKIVHDPGPLPAEDLPLLLYNH